MRGGLIHYETTNENESSAILLSIPSFSNLMCGYGFMWILRILVVLIFKLIYVAIYVYTCLEVDLPW
jgi:hypothetical protein